MKRQSNTEGFHRAGPLLATVGVLAFAAVASAQAELRILALDMTRSRSCDPGDYAFVSGDVHEAMRGALLDPAAFGPAGVVDRVPVLAETGELDEASLQEADIVVLTTTEGDPLTACEERLLRAFVEQGGGLFAFNNTMSAAVSPVVGTGDAISCTGHTFGFASAGHPVLSEPFGELSGTFGHVHVCFMETVPSEAEPLIVSGTDVVGIALPAGDGRAVVINDNEWAMSSACSTGAFFWGSESRVLALNVFAWIAPDPGFQFAPPPYDCPPDVNLDCTLDFFDFLDFQSLYAAGDPRADFNQDGALDFFDFLAFQNAFSAGCP